MLHARQLTSPFDTDAVNGDVTLPDPADLLEELPPLSEVLRAAMLGGGTSLEALNGFPELSIPDEQRAALVAHVRETVAAAAAAADSADDSGGGGEGGSHSSGGISRLPVDWVVDICDTSNDWFFGTAISYNDDSSMVHVAVPDAGAPVWEGDVELHSQTLKMVECHDGRTDALFKEIIRASSLPVDWRLRLATLLPQPAAATGAAAEGAVREARDGEAAEGFAAHARYFLPMGGYVLVELEGDSSSSSSSSSNAASGLRLINVEASVTLLSCECEGAGADAFYQLAEDGIVQYDVAEVDWRGYKAAAAAAAAARASRRGSGASSGGSAAGFSGRESTDGIGGGGGGRRRTTMGGRGVAELCEEMRAALECTRDAREAAVAQHTELLRRLRNFILEGDLVDGEWLLDNATDEVSARGAAVECAAMRDATVEEVVALQEAFAIALEASARGGSGGGSASGGGDKSSPSIEDLQREKESLEAELEELSRQNSTNRRPKGPIGEEDDGNGTADGADAGEDGGSRNRLGRRRSSGAGGGGGGPSGLLPRMFRRSSSRAAGTLGGGGGDGGKGDDRAAIESHSMSPSPRSLTEHGESSPGSAVSVASAPAGSRGNGSGQRKGSVLGGLFARKGRGGGDAAA